MKQLPVLNCFRSEYRRQYRACMQPGSGCGIFFSPGSIFPPPVLLIGNTIIEPRGCFKQPFPLRGVRIPPGRAFCIIGNSEEFPIIQEKPLKNQGFQAETVGFEPTCRDEPTNAFRVRRVTASSLHLQSVPLAFQRHLLYYTKFFPVCHLVLQLFCLFLLSSLLSGAEKLIKAVGNSQSDSVLVLLLR